MMQWTAGESAGVPPGGLAPQSQPLNDGLVPFRGCRRQVLEKLRPVSNHHEQTPTRGMVLLVSLEMLGEVLNARRNEGHLDLGGAGILLVPAVLRNQRLLSFSVHLHPQQTFLPLRSTREPTDTIQLMSFSLTEGA